MSGLSSVVYFVELLFGLRFFEWRLAAARDDPRALAVVYDELREHLGEKRARGGRGTAHVWRVISAAGGGLVTGDAIGPELERQVEAIFRYDAGDQRFCPGGRHRFASRTSAT